MALLIILIGFGVAWARRRGRVSGSEMAFLDGLNVVVVVLCMRGASSTYIFQSTYFVDKCITILRRAGAGRAGALLSLA
jgi:hypothetical protein